MPITDHEKELRLHPRPFSDYLAAIPIKKRPFMIPRSPSPPPELPSPVLADCCVPGNKQESSETCSKAGGNSVHGSVVTSEVTTSELHDPPSVTSSDCGICEKKSKSSELGYNFARTGGNAAQLNIVMGKVSSFESHESFSSAPADFHITDKKPDFSETATPFLTSGCNLVQANSSPAEHASCEPCDLPSPTPSGCDISEKKTECTLNICPTHIDEPGSHFLSIGGNPAWVNSFAGERVSGEFCEESRSRALNICLTHEILPRFNNQGSGTNFAANFMYVGNVQGMDLNDESATWPGIGNAAPPSATEQTFEASVREGNFNSRFSLSEAILVKQEDVRLQTMESMVSDTKHKTDSSHFCLNRSNWDLNIPMDAWEGSSADSLLNRESAGNHLQDVGGVQSTCLELGLNQNVLNKARESDELLRIYDLQKNFKFPDMGASMVDSISETSLNLQLKPSFLPNSCNRFGKHDATNELPLLSLGTQPVLATSGPPLSLGRTVKSEPIERIQEDTGKVLKQIKSEPREEKETSKTTISANKNLASGKALKAEPLEEQSQEHARGHEEHSFHIAQKSYGLVPHSKPMDETAGDNDSKTMDVASDCLDLNTVLHPCTGRPDVNTFNSFSDMAAKVPILVNRDPIPANDISISPDTIEDPIGIHTEHSAVASKSHVSDGTDINSLPEACETSSLPKASLPENLNNNGGGNDNSEGAPELLVPMETSNSHHSSNVTSTDEVIPTPCVNVRAVKSDAIEGKVGAEEPSNSHPSSNVTSTDEVIPNPCVNVRAVESDDIEGKVGAEEPGKSADTNHIRRGQDEDDYKDGEMRDPVLNDAVKISSSMKAADSICPDDVPVPVPFVADSSKEADALTPKENEGDLNECKVEPCSLAFGVLTNEADNSIIKKIIPRTLKDHPEDNKGLEKMSKSSDLVTKTVLPDSQKQNVEGPSLAKNYDLRKIDRLEKEGATKGVNDRGSNRRIIYLNSSPYCLAVGNKKSTLDRPISSRGGRERPFNRTFRDESVNERSRNAKNEWHYGHQTDDLMSDSRHITSRADRDANHEHISEQRNNSVGTRYSPEFSNRQTRKLKNEETQNLSRLPFQRRSPGSQLQIPLGHHRSRCIRRDVPDFVLLGHQDTQYGREEGVLLRRERRSLSPPLRRGGPLHLPPNCTGSIQQPHSTHQWSPPRRSSDGFNGQQELVRQRSPPIMRNNRMRSPHEEMIVRRRGSLNYDMMDVGPSREQDFPRMVRGSSRNSRRFDMIDPREIAEDEYFDPRAVDNRIQEFGVDGEFVENRGCNERRQPMRESFRFHNEDVPNPRDLGFNPDANEGRGPRDFDTRFRNRLGNSSGRFRGSVEEQDGNYSLHAERDWRDATYNDSRTKRRRF